MASSKMLNEVIGDVTECSICTEEIKDSKVLPCVHTFCRKCLEELWKDKKPGDKVPCPVCRMEFDIPTGGVAELPKNFFVEKLLDAQKCQSNMSASDVTCDICSSLRNENNKVIISAAEKHCLDCQQNLCSHCANIHLVTKGLEGHRVNPIGESTVSAKCPNYSLKRCDQHIDKKIEVYCLECKTAVCMTCFFIKHNGHKGSDINDVAEDLKNQIKTDIDESDKLLQEVNNQSEQLQRVLDHFVVKMDETENTFVQRGNKIKQFVDKHVQDMLQKLRVRKTEKMKEFEMAKEKLLVQKTSFESFIRKSRTLLEKACLSDIARFASPLNTTFKNLTNSKITHVGDLTRVLIVASDLETCSSITKNMIGDFIINDPMPIGKNTTFVSVAEASNLSKVAGVTVSEKEVFVIRQSSSEIKVFDCETLAFLRNISIPSLKDPWDITFSENILFVGERTLQLIHRIPLISSQPQPMCSWTVDGSNLSLSTMKSNNILVTCGSESKLVEYTTWGTIVRTIVLPPSMTKPCHAIQVDNDRFLVGHIRLSHLTTGSLHRVCLIDNKGQLINSYGGSKGLGTVELINPYHLAADANGFCLIVEHGGTNRVLMLNTDLKFVKEFSPVSTGLKSPLRLCLDRNRKRLYVADYSNARIVAFNVCP